MKQYSTAILHPKDAGKVVNIFKEDKNKRVCFIVRLNNNQCTLHYFIGLKDIKSGEQVGYARALLRYWENIILPQIHKEYTEFCIKNNLQKTPHPSMHLDICLED